jgi:hypothetical protein
MASEAEFPLSLFGLFCRRKRHYLGIGKPGGQAIETRYCIPDGQTLRGRAFTICLEERLSG